MIKFKNIRVKNFGSYGNYPTVIDLESFSTNLVVGNNGSGKSTILLDGIFFVLFNKPYRKITKGLLVNSINKGGTLVEIEFETKGSTYIVRRGIKPNLFEIEKDGEKLDQDVLSKDSQIFLEEDILQTNPKTFGQTSVLGSSSFVPFMQLPAAGRREVVDDVLDVHVFTRMSDLAKEDLSITNKNLLTKENELSIVKTKFSSQKQIIKVIEDGQQELLDALLEEKEKIVTKISSNDALSKELHSVYIDLKDELLEVNESEYKSAKKIEGNLESEITRLKVLVSRIDDLDICPTCFQKVDEEHKRNLVKESLESILELETKLKQVAEEIESFVSYMKHNEEIGERIRTIQTNTNILKLDTQKLNVTLKEISTKIDKANSSSNVKITDEKIKLKELSDQGKVLSIEISDLKKKKAIEEVSVKMLKDNGIKATIVKEYLPILNSLINQNLISYGFDVSFNLNENFEETISSRGRENFTYNSFSEGEKEKIDYSIMLALRRVGSTKNATNTNILVLDEILDGSLDKDSRSVTLDILTRDMEESNVFVISHTESQPTFYERVLKVHKKGDFSYIEKE